MSTRMERRQSRHRVRRARWTGIAVGAGASVVLGLGAAGALPGVSVGTPPAESPATTVTLPAQAQPASPVSPQAKAPAVTPGSVGATASAAGAGNATTNPVGAVTGAANAAAKSANADAAATPAAPSTGGSPATPLGPSSTDTGTSRAAAQVGNPNAQAALAASVARASSTTNPGQANSAAVRSTRPSRASVNGRAWAWGGAPRGTNQLTVSGCLGTSDPLAVTPEVCAGIEGNLAVHLVVPSTGEAMTSGSVSFTLPSGITLDSLTPTTSTGSEGTGVGTCSYSGSVTVTNDVVTISGITCTQDAGFVWYFAATVGSAPGTYTMSGGYRTDDQPRNATNVYRWPAELSVTVA